MDGQDPRRRREIPGMPPIGATAEQQPGALPVGGEVAPAHQTVIGEPEIIKATETLKKYKAGKGNLERRVIECEQWWKRRHWDYISAGNKHDDQPASAWLHNSIVNKHADALDAYPEPNIRPREPGDKDEAKVLTAIVPVVLEQNEFEDTYAAQSLQKLIQGTGIYGVFWDKGKLFGMGDISVRKMDALNIYWEPGVTDIQQSRHVFTTELVDIDLLRDMYPDVLGEETTVTGKAFSQAEYLYDDNVDTTDKALVVDWYYHKPVGGRQVLHYAKFVDAHVLYATENDPERAETGLYDHGMFPFVFDPLFPIEGSPCGYGYIDIGRAPQEMVDRLNQAITKNALMGATPRYFSNAEGSVNEQEFADWTKPIVHVTGGRIDESALRPIDTTNLDAIYMNVLTAKIDELKETTGNRDVSTGGAPAGVTAASAIATLQEQAGKSSKSSIRTSYRAYSKVCMMIIELIRQFYTLPRQFRIVGDAGTEEFVSYANEGLQPEPLVAGGQEIGMRLPVFDIRVTPQKMNAYTKMAQNELALQLYQLGVLNPANADASLALLDIMDFTHKDLVEDKVRQNGTMHQALAMYMQIALTLAEKSGDAQTADMIAQNILSMQQGLNAGVPQGAQGASELHAVDPVSGVARTEHANVRNARARAQDSVQPS